MSDVARFLVQKGYAPLKVQDRIVSAAAKKMVSVLGEAPTKALMFHMTSLTGLGEKELLANFKALERALWSVFGCGADIMLKRLNDELAAATRSAGLGLNEMLDEIRRDEPLAFVRNVNYGEHALLLYKSIMFRDKMVKGFFDSPAKESRAAIMAGPLPESVTAVTYDQLAQRYGPQSAPEKAGEWAFSLQRGVHLRLATDNTGLAEKGVQEADNRRDRSPWNNAAVLCAYNAEKIGDHASIISKSHDFVVLEDTNAVYARAAPSP
jgi:hypothetical protein